MVTIILHWYVELEAGPSKNHNYVGRSIHCWLTLKTFHSSIWKSILTYVAKHSLNWTLIWKIEHIHRLSASRYSLSKNVLPTIILARLPRSWNVFGNGLLIFWPGRWVAAIHPMTVLTLHSNLTFTTLIKFRIQVSSVYHRYLTRYSKNLMY